MHCRICDKMLTTIQFNSDHKDIEPCPECLQVISEVFGEEEDDPHEVILGDATEEESLEVMKDIPWLPEYARPPMEFFIRPSIDKVE